MPHPPQKRYGFNIPGPPLSAGPVSELEARCPAPPTIRELGRSRPRVKGGEPPSLPSVGRSGTSLEACLRSEERRVGQECVRTCRSRWSPLNEKNTNSKCSRSELYLVI